MVPNIQPNATVNPKEMFKEARSFGSNLYSKEVKITYNINCLKYSKECGV